ncbi:hypothetical protein WOLCODRAFT_100521 [Wolfiporia cocos MD-104 SS10]|uniref:HSF-type DNA-binding domain-containing protein n=1 Tax=Wolfiporia cocos (strain MD-104) TaxID=742152 RepID=A0A2H3JGV3_WOLCO|nr:hypothetical protein WOLCODRAFT_100521 [Wolfiporia cocos MD-104 SS10]
MADLYPQTYSSRAAYHHRQDSPQYAMGTTSGSLVYPPLLTSQPAVQDDHQSHSPSDEQSPSRDSQSPKHDTPPAQKPEGAPQQAAKPQATFLTKLYALLERPENHHMIRWDPAGEHIIVERPEQLALHVLPSVYRQSRFASFSRQLNIYGFMRKVNLRNVDPAIDDPDASTWSHPTLNRHSPPEVVANFKRRVPPRVPKPRKRDNEVPQPLPSARPQLNIGPMGMAQQPGSPRQGARARGFSAPGSFTPLTQPGAPGWGTSYPRSTLPPLTVPEPPMSSHASMYSQHSAHPLHPITPTDDAPTSSFTSPMSYTNSSREAMMLPSPNGQYPYASDSATSWAFSPTSAASSHSSGSLSSLLNPSGSVSSAYSNSSRPTPPQINTYTSYNGVQMSRGHHSAAPLSPESRPTSGYSSSMSSLPDPYAESPNHYSHHDYSRPSSSHHQQQGRPLTPSSSRPPSSKSYNNAGSLSIRRARRHSQAMQPYPSPYAEHPPLSAGSDRPSSSPQPGDEHSSAIPRVRSMIQLPTVDGYGFNSSQSEFAYAAVDDGHAHQQQQQQQQQQHQQHLYGVSGRSVRPSTSASSLSTASSAANTPGEFAPGTGEADINRCEYHSCCAAGRRRDACGLRYGGPGDHVADCGPSYSRAHTVSPDFGFVQMNEHIPQYAKAGEM